MKNAESENFSSVAPPPPTSLPLPRKAKVFIFVDFFFLYVISPHSLNFHLLCVKSILTDSSCRRRRKRFSTRNSSSLTPTPQGHSYICIGLRDEEKGGWIVTLQKIKTCLRPMDWRFLRVVCLMKTTKTYGLGEN